MLRRIRPWVRRNDLALCHVETPLVPGRPRLPALQLTVRAARAISWAGFDACSTASNHSVDRGRTGSTRRGELSAAAACARGYRLERAPGPRAAAAARQGRRLAFLAYTGTRTACRCRTPGRSTSPRRGGSSATPAGAPRRRAGGDRQPALGNRVPARAGPVPARSRARWRVRRGHRGGRPHAHVVQPIRRIDGKPVVFGGATCSRTRRRRAAGRAARTACSSGCACAWRRPGAASRVDYVPTWVRHPDYTVVRAAPGSASWRRTVAVAGRGPRLAPVGTRAAAPR